MRSLNKLAISLAGFPERQTGNLGAGNLLQGAAIFGTGPWIARLNGTIETAREWV